MNNELKEVGFQRLYEILSALEMNDRKYRNLLYAWENQSTEILRENCKLIFSVISLFKDLPKSEFEARHLNKWTHGDEQDIAIGKVFYRMTSKYGSHFPGMNAGHSEGGV